MLIEVENLGVQRRNFQELSTELSAQGKVFDTSTLAAIPYEQLTRCCIGDAGAAACDISLVRAEKARRRERYLDMSTEDLSLCSNFLRIEQMNEDIKYAVACNGAPSWETLTTRQKVWFKLNCVFNHIENPQDRLFQICLLLRLCLVEHNSGLPSDVCHHYIARLKNLSDNFPAIMSEKLFRDQIWDIAENILEFLPNAEHSICDKEELKDFSCTSDCFRVYT